MRAFWLKNVGKIGKMGAVAAVESTFLMRSEFAKAANLDLLSVLILICAAIAFWAILIL